MVGRGFDGGPGPYPYDELEEIWRDILLNQFHDILPGSSIAVVNDEAVASFAKSAERLEAVVDRAISALCGEGDVPVAFNAAPHAQSGVPALSAAPVVPGTGTARLVDETGAGGTIVLDNGLTRVEIGTNGHITSLVDLVAGREVIPPGAVGNVLQLHPDVPNRWPAWDVDAFYRHVHQDLEASETESTTVVSRGPEEVAVRFDYVFGRSRAAQVLRLSAGRRELVVETDVDWHERDRFLKVALPVDVHADQSSSEIQFGHVERPTHNNTSWDDARFEFVAHRFVHVGEPGYGVAVVNDGIYGHEVRALPREGGGRATLVRLSILRSATFPDPRGENGLHHFRYALVPGAAMTDAVRHGYQFNLPLRAAMAEREIEPVVAVANEAVVVEAVKAADDRSGDLVVRCYESLGGRATTTVRAGFPVRRAQVTDLLERHLDDLEVEDGHQLRVELKPFQVITLRLSPQSPSPGSPPPGSRAASADGR